jgi:hypothetical protein
MKTTLMVNRGNVGRIAERIVANELEAQNFRVSDLNKDGISANADLLAAGHNKVWQIQVKGATNQSKRWWVQYGYCTPEIIKKTCPMFNRRQGFYKADIVVLVAVRSPTEYRCVVLPAKDAKRAAQLNLDRSFRTPTLRGGEKKPSKVWITLEGGPRDRITGLKAQAAERKILKRALEMAWKTLLATP